MNYKDSAKYQARRGSFLRDCAASGGKGYARPAVGVAATALALDVLLGDPPNRYHPTAWMGSLIHWMQRYRPQRNNPEQPRAAAELAFGAVTVVGGAALVGGLGALAQCLCARLPTPLGMLLIAALLKSTISLHGLDHAAGQVQAALQTGNLSEARRLLSYHLVSRDTASLDEAGVAAATIESVAENASDGIIAPLMWYALGGLPLALAYRFANTADAMLGYHTPVLEWLGKVPARLDDALNWLPARISAWLLAIAAPAGGGATSAARQVMQRDAASTESPNAGYPMSAMAGTLGVELEKHGHYRLNAGARRPTGADIARARRVLWVAVGLSLCLAVVQKGIFSAHDNTNSPS